MIKLYTVRHNEGKSHTYPYIKDALMDFYLWIDTKSEVVLTKGNQVIIKANNGEIDK